MEEIQRQVRRARARLVIEQLIQALTWSLFASFSVALIAILTRKIWPLAVDGASWQNGWMIAAAATGAICGLAWTCLRGRGMLDAAIEIDRRCHLKERVSSAISISPDEIHSEAGQALLADAQRQLSRVDVGQHFRQRLTWHAALPVVAAATVFLVVWLVPDARRDVVSASPDDKSTKQQVQKSLEELKKRLAEKKMAKKTPDDPKKADAIFTEFKKAVDELSQQTPDRKKALIQLNNLTKKIATRSQDLEASRKMRQQLRQLKNIQQGPAERMANALKNGNMKQALQELKRLQDKMKSGDLSEKEKQDLVNQLKQLRDEVEKRLAAKRDLENKARDLKKKIAELQQQGNTAGAGQLRKKLDQVRQQLDNLNRRDSELARLDQLAQQLNDAAESIKNGDMKEAGSKMDQMAESLAQMQSEMEMLEDLDQMAMDISSAKDAMNCQKCNGEGCAECQGNAMAMPGDRPGKGDGSGEGEGNGERPEEETETGGYRTRVAAKPKPGKAIRVGDARGRNLAGQSQQAVQEEVASSFSEDPDPVINQRLPRREREQTKEYFERFRTGK